MKLHTCWLHVLWLLLLCILADSIHGRLNSSSKKHNDRDYVAKSACNISASCVCCNTQQIHVTFSTKIIENEYIVVFKGYYKPQTRRNYIGAALNSSGVNNWTILPRHNLASRFPSDFDIILLEETVKYHGLRALDNHPLVRRVTPQRLVHRNLKFINTTTHNLDVPEYKNLKRQTNTYVSIQIMRLVGE